MWIEEYSYHISHYTSETLLNMELNALNRIITDDPIYSKEILKKIDIVKKQIDIVLNNKKPSI